MKVVRLHGVGDIRIADEDQPTPGPGESLVRVTAVGLCGSDLHWFTEGGIGDSQLLHPLVLGHEFAGVVEGGLDDGRRVAVDPARPCGTCELCLEGNRNLCLSVRFAGHGGDDGALRDYLAWPTALLHTVPDDLSDADSAMLEPLGVALHAHDLGKTRAGGDVAVIGCGPIGLCLVQVARAAGARHVVAIEPLGHRREAAAAMGADVVLDSGADDVRAALAEATGGRGVDVAFEAAGNDAAVALAARRRLHNDSYVRTPGSWRAYIEMFALSFVSGWEPRFRTAAMWARFTVRRPICGTASGACGHRSPPPPVVP